MRTFLWGGVEGHNKLAWIKWDVVCKPKELGGLGIKNWSLFNKALLGKWRWRLIHEQDSLWVAVLRAKYRIPILGEQVEMTGKFSEWWKDILRTCFENPTHCWFDAGISKKLGDGNEVFFWLETLAGPNEDEGQISQVIFAIISTKCYDSINGKLDRGGVALVLAMEETFTGPRARSTRLSPLYLGFGNTQGRNRVVFQEGIKDAEKVFDLAQMRMELTFRSHDLKDLMQKKTNKHGYMILTAPHTISGKLSADSVVKFNLEVLGIRWKMAPSKQDSGDTGVIKLIRRGRTIMKEVRRATSQGIKFEVGWDPDGVPIDPNKQKFVSYIGYLARTDVPITCNWWPNVDDEIKNQIWEKVEVAFEIHPLRKDYVLKEAGVLARNFRKILRKFFLDKDGNVIDHPPLSYDLVIDHDVWMEFVDQYKDEEFQKLSEQNRKRVLKPKYPHNLGRTGYACLQQKMLQESGSSETSIPRHRLWKRARVSKKGKINENVEEVLSTCETLTQSASQEELHKRTPDDILGQALKVPEHPGRVRGATFPICQKTFFKKGQKKSIQKETPAEVAQLTDLVKTLQKQVSILLQEREITKDIGAVHYASGRDSCTPNISPVEIHEVFGSSSVLYWLVLAIWFNFL
ncbi:uncharacterized protein LOC130740224 [Lotus japonicus]|uniref:uncharacterized protein LOC130740224 n=1 Tax=Lotus japonicus TaxID=34305 RepID=UPI002589A88B|nr:uncharacterized protein LOC130740224 [Lotus japonicus]